MSKARRGGTRSVYKERWCSEARSEKVDVHMHHELTFQRLELPALMSVNSDLAYPGGGGGGIDGGGGGGGGSGSGSGGSRGGGSV